MVSAAEEHLTSGMLANIEQTLGMPWFVDSDGARLWIVDEPCAWVAGQCGPDDPEGFRLEKPLFDMGGWDSGKPVPTGLFTVPQSRRHFSGGKFWTDWSPTERQIRKSEMQVPQFIRPEL